MPPAGAIEGVTAQACRGSIPVLRQVCELDAVVGHHGVYVIGHRLDQLVEEGDGTGNVGLVPKPGKSNLQCPVDRDEEVELAFPGADLGNVDVEVADRL